MQNYALQKILVELGHQPITLREPKVYPNYSSQSAFIKWYFKGLIRYFLGKITGRTVIKPRSRNRFIKNCADIRRFADNTINCTPVEEKFFENDIDKYGLDALIVGSDQVWRPRYNRYMIWHQFLEFAENRKLKKIAYAASFGTDKWEFNDEETQKSSELIRNFDAVSVREYAAIKQCQEHWGITPEVVLDPTMLVSKNNYLSLCESIPVRKDRYIFAYIIDSSDKKKDVVLNQMADSLGLSIIKMGCLDVNLGDSVEKWLAYFRDATYILTDSFHGTVFSLLFNKEFICLGDSGRGNARMETLVRRFGLRDRIVKSFISIPSEPLNYNNINAIIDKERAFSIKFIEDSLT